MATLDKIFKTALHYNASDVHVVPGEPFIIRRLGQLTKLKSPNLTPEQTRQVVYEILTPEQQQQLEQDMQLDFAVDRENVGRFRGSAMVHNRGMSCVFRAIPPQIPQLDALGFPEVVTRILENHQGLILVTGATGQGKSTTLAAMVDYINTNRSHHVLTVEDPIEFIHPIKNSVVNQRQLGIDTLSYDNALRAALREDPDVIVIGELRDLATISLAISAAETGHLVIGTLSTSSAPKTVDRVIDAYPPKEQSQIRAMLAESLKAVITQRLLPSKDKKSQVLAVEILVGTLPIANLIKDGKTFQIPNLMATSKRDGMQDMDDSITQLLKDDIITAKTAYENANKPEKFRMQFEKEQKESEEASQ